MKTLADQECAAELVSRLRNARRDAPRQWGRMTAHQMICHLCDSFRFALGERPVGDVSNLVNRTLA